MSTIPRSLLTAVGVQVLCQLFKVFYYSIRSGSLDLRFFVRSGGMPSSHAAFVTALTTAVAFGSGIASDLFAVSAVFSFIVIHDAVRVRGTIEEQGRIIRRLAGSIPDIEIGLPDTIGHTIGEIAVGVAAGGILTAASMMVI